MTSRSFIRWTLKHGFALWVIALLLAVPAMWRTGALYMHLKSDVEALLPRESESVKAIEELRARMDGLMYLGVIVDVGKPENIQSGERFLDDLSKRIATYPLNLARAVRIGTAEEQAFLKKHAPMYIDADDLREIRSRIESRRDWEVSRATGSLLNDSAPPPLEFSDIEAKYAAKLPKEGERSGTNWRWSSDKLRTTMLLVEVGKSFSSGASSAKDLLQRVKNDIAELDPNRYAPGMSVGFSGDVAISVEETNALLSDLSVSSILVVIAVIAVIITYFRWARSVAILLAPLILATAYAFALASLPPFSVTELNTNTAFLGSIIVGNGVNFGIVLLARYVEERRRGSDVEEALVQAVRGSRLGTWVAAVAACCSYASLALTQFRGFRQFGTIGGIGMLLSWGAAFLLMPSLVRWLDRGGKTAPMPLNHPHRVMRFLTLIVKRYAPVVVLIGAALMIAAGVSVHRFDMSHVEYDFSKLRRADTWTKGEGYWGRKMDALLGGYLTPTVILADSEEKAREVARRLTEARARPPLADTVAQVRTIDDVLPSDQAAKLEEIAAIREAITPAIREHLPEKGREAIDRFIGEDEQTLIALADLPRAFTTALREKNGDVGRAVLVYPRPSKALWQGPSLVGYVSSLRTIAGESRVAGSLPLSADILSSIQHDGPIASAAAFVGVILVVIALFRFRVTTVYVIGSLAVGILLLIGSVSWLGIKINFANFIAFPITFGIGVDYAVNIVSRYDEGGRKDILAAVRTTGSAVGLCSLTTIIGYSSLLLAQNRALFLFGLVAVLGEIACLSVAVTLLPATILMIKRLG